MDYRPRIVDAELDALLEGLPAVSLEGPKAVGKTETALRRARTVHRLDDPARIEIVLGAPATGHEAYRRADGIGVIPASLLTA